MIPSAASGVQRCGNPEGMIGKRSPSNAPIAATRVRTKRTAENKIYWRTGSSLTEPSSGVRDDFDRGLQCLEPPLAIAGMRPLARMAENVALDILFYSGGSIRQPGVAQIGSRGVPVRIKRFVRVGDLDDVSQPGRALGRYLTCSLAVGVERQVGDSGPPTGNDLQ